MPPASFILRSGNVAKEFTNRVRVGCHAKRSDFGSQMTISDHALGTTLGRDHRFPRLCQGIFQGALFNIARFHDSTLANPNLRKNSKETGFLISDVGARVATGNPASWN
jgi:hypothetical protein